MCALVTGVQTCALPIWLLAIELTISLSFEAVNGGPRAGLSPVHPNPAAGPRRRNGARSAPRPTAAAGLRPRRVRAGRRRQGLWRSEERRVGQGCFRTFSSRCSSYSLHKKFFTFFSSFFF